MDKVDLTRTLVREAVILDCDSFTSKEDLFDKMAQSFLESGIITDKKKYINALQYREKQGPTYMGNLIAMPHGKCDEVKRPGIGFYRCKSPFMYKSCGEEGPVKFIFMLAIAGTQTGDDYMRILATLAGLLVNEDFIELLDKCSSYDELIEKINQYQN